MKGGEVFVLLEKVYLKLIFPEETPQIKVMRTGGIFIIHGWERTYISDSLDANGLLTCRVDSPWNPAGINRGGWKELAYNEVHTNRKKIEGETENEAGGYLGFIIL